MSKTPKKQFEKVMPQIDPFEEDTIDLYELWMTLWNRKKFIIYFCSICVALTAIISLIMTPIFKAETTVIPISSKSSSLGGLSDIAALAGISVGGSGDDTQKIMAVLNSRTIKESIITRMDLLKELLDEMPEDRNPMLAAIEKFDKIISISSDRTTGLINISVEHEKPELSRDIANTYVLELKDTLNSKSLSVSKMRREFLERQIKQVEIRFKKEQQQMAKFQKRTKMLHPVEQAKGTMELYTELISKKIALEFQIRSMEMALTSDSPVLKSLNGQMKLIKKKIRGIEGRGDLGALPTLGNAPDKIIEYMDLYKNLEVSKTVYKTLLQMYEQAKLEEAQESLFIQVIDPAVTPDKKAKPKRALMVIVVGFTSLFFSVFLVFFLEWISNVRGMHMEEE